MACRAKWTVALPATGECNRAVARAGGRGPQGTDKHSSSNQRNIGWSA
eukprot:CAMPEP_0185193774 /NCGR_PEP_ID=MMETSP1140-20130426/27612_1 /TAXON_ID=298111 /ORGANISM="Pavlova sp., Strain CCMP459" /LENGTH=47 /DNA_ID= /DNA_START= /DNA_END= /DNA_ORIENTATION=